LTARSADGEVERLGLGGLVALLPALGLLRDEVDDLVLEIVPALALAVAGPDARLGGLDQPVGVLHVHRLAGLQRVLDALQRGVALLRREPLLLPARGLCLVAEVKGHRLLRAVAQAETARLLQGLGGGLGGLALAGPLALTGEVRGGVRRLLLLDGR